MPPPKPPASTKPPIPKKQLDDDILTSAPKIPPRSNKPVIHRDSSSVYIAPTAAPLDPAMETTQQDKARQIRREQRQQKEALEDARVIAELKAICTEADPTKLYRNMIKIGQG